jgi:hypothetical protein
LESRQSVPVLTPFTLCKRVILQAAWAAGCSIFAHEPVSSANHKIQQDVIERYRELGRFVIDQLIGDTARDQ